MRGRFVTEDEERLSRDDAQRVVRRLRVMIRPWRSRI